MPAIRIVSALMKYLVDLRVPQSVIVCVLAVGCSSPETEEPAMTTDALGSNSTSSASGTSSTGSAQTTPSPSGTTSQNPTSTSTSSTTTTTNTATSSATSSSASSSSNTTSSTATSSGGSTSSSDTGEVPVPTFYEVQTILQYSCVLVSCHSPLYNMPNMSNFDSEEALHERLLSYQVKSCSDVMLVKPGEPENSGILKVVSHGCGDFIMPPLCTDPCLDPAYFASLEAWIKAGAPAD